MLGRDIDSGCPIRDHNRTSPRFEIEGILFPMLTLSEAEHGAYHNGNVSDAHNPQRIYDTLWMQAYPVAPRRDPTADLPGVGIGVLGYWATPYTLFPILAPANRRTKKRLLL